MEQKRFKYLFILPTHNESAILERSVAVLFDFISGSLGQDRDFRILIADNGSTDGAGSVFERIKDRYRGRLLYEHIPEKGRGNALRHTAARHEADIYMYCDADIPFGKNDLTGLLTPVEKGQADAITGRRIEQGQRPFPRSWLTLGVRVLTRLLFDLSLRDPQCGIKVFNKKAAIVLAQQCRENGYYLDTELLALGQRHGLKIGEAPVHWIEQRFSDRTSKIRGVRDSWSALKAYYRLFRSLYPHGIAATLALLGGSFCLLGLLLWNKYSLFLPDFKVASQYLDSHVKMLQVSGPLIAFSGAMYYLVRAIKFLPWRFALLIITLAFIMISAVGIATLPTGSQDVYWNLLLAKGFVQQGLNPYLTNPDNLSNDTWSSPVIFWRGMSMTHGPFWVIFLAGIVLVTSSMLQALVMLKIAMAACIILTGMVLWRTARKRFGPGQCTVLMALFFWNPFLIQTAIIDVHNDTLMMLAICLSYLFLVRRQENLSILALVAGGLVKYVAWFMLPIPVILMIKRLGIRKATESLFWLGLAAGAILFLSYLPFGNPLQLTSGLSEQWSLSGISHMEINVAVLAGSQLLYNFFGLDSGTIRLTGFIAALLLELVLVLRNRILAAYIWPLAVLLFWGTPWFQPWYVLWIFPLILLAFPGWVFVLLGIGLLIMNQVMDPLYFSSILSFLILAGVGFWIMARHPIRFSPDRQDIAMDKTIADKI